MITGILISALAGTCTCLGIAVGMLHRRVNKIEAWRADIDEMQDHFAEAAKDAAASTSLRGDEAWRDQVL